LQLTGGSCRCFGMLEVRWEGSWSPVCRDSVSKAAVDGICQQLGCGPHIPQPFQIIHKPGKELQRRLLRCLATEDDPTRCRWVLANCTERAILTCSEPVKTTPNPTPVPAVSSLEPPGPARLRLVDGNSSCSGFVELYKQGLWGAVASSPPMGLELATHICQDLQCGNAIHGHPHHLQAKLKQGSHLPVRWEMVEPCEKHQLFDCFNRTHSQRGEGPPAFIICEGSQPQALRRLAAGPTPCEGDMEVFHQGQWQVLCVHRTQRAQWGRQLCRELRCGNLSSSSETQEPPAMGVSCKVPILHLSHLVPFILFPGQDSKPHLSGVAAGTIVSICLALLLFGVLLLICGPPAYRRLMKRISKKKQRQWIGPTGLNQTVSFHRNSTVTSRPQGQRMQGGNNDYAQPPQKSSCLSAYPALEGACRTSNPPDNSSDSDYDLHSARRV
ncbi:CD5 protein, partial [Bucco capensis]|nr:CD5 protein [Bucco capensis]